MLGDLEYRTLISFELVGSGVYLDWVLKILKCHQFTIKERNGEVGESFLLSGAICYFTFFQLTDLWFPS